MLIISIFNALDYTGCFPQSWFVNEPCNHEGFLLINLGQIWVFMHFCRNASQTHRLQGMLGSAWHWDAGEAGGTRDALSREKIFHLLGQQSLAQIWRPGYPNGTLCHAQNIFREMLNPGEGPWKVSFVPALWGCRKAENLDRSPLIRGRWGPGDLPQAPALSLTLWMTPGRLFQALSIYTGRSCGQDEAGGGSWMDKGSTAALGHLGSSPPHDSQSGFLWIRRLHQKQSHFFLPSPPSTQALRTALCAQELKLHLAKEVTPAIQCFLHCPSLHTWAKAMVNLTFWDIWFKNSWPVQVEMSCYKSSKVVLGSACQVWSCSEKSKCAHLLWKCK